MSFIGTYILEISYIIASVLFILGLKMLSHPVTARRGNLLAAFGMTFAIIATILWHRHNGTRIHNVGYIIAAIAAGLVVGWLIAVKVKMTAMPQLVSFFNGMGGACAALISLMEFPCLGGETHLANMLHGEVLAIIVAMVIGSVSFTGSMIAFGKLDGRIHDWKSPVVRIINIIFLVVIVALAIFVMSRGQVDPRSEMIWMYLLLGIALVYGIFFVMPIGGADMPVVISLLNSFTGVAAAMGGFLYDNQAMLTGGILVGSAGTILTVLMCKAMNRSLGNVILGAFGGSSGSAENDVDGHIKEITLSDASVLLNYSQKVVIIPGYGLAAAQAQHICSELDEMLTNRGVDVKYAIHPVAGRMPGHMNVLLAEADVPYEKLVEMENINPAMPNVDVAVVIGANDVVNPAALDDPCSPIYGMPIINAHEAKNIIVMKRGMGKGYAAIENNLFYHDKTRMLFGNAKDTLQSLVGEIKNL
ncbi:MAG: NAD(P)(+) transhydrogenase (Re/Si-specific) subunit beta [Bacteroidales bacterium]|nr:NAD(P)(+) transhydrogenase (Re/Si-specific) subunit beta [Bacteroidales bacterium]